MTDSEIATLDVLWFKQLSVFESELQFTEQGFSTSSAPNGVDLECVFVAKGGELTANSVVKAVGQGSVVINATGQGQPYRQDLEARMAHAPHGPNGNGPNKLKKEIRL